MKNLTIFLLCLALFGCGSTNPSAWEKAQGLEQNGEHSQALKIANNAVGISVSKLNPARRANLITAQFGSATSGLAEDILKITSSLKEKENAQFHLCRGFLYSAIGEYEMALKDYERALELDKDAQILALGVPAKNCALYLKAITLWQTGKIKEAVSGLDEVILVNPDFQEAYYYRGIIKAKLNDKEGATLDLKKAVTIGGKMPAQQMLEETSGTNQTGETLSGTFLVSFFANQPPLSRPYGYIWMIEQ